MNQPPSYRIFSLGDTALTVEFGNVISEEVNERVLALFQHLSSRPLPGMIEAVPAYCSLSVFFDVFTTKKKVAPGQTVFEFISGHLAERLATPVPGRNSISNLVKVPVCYNEKYAPDLYALATLKGLDIEEVISIHSGATYKVYMLGFLPGFGYLGEVDDRISVGRKPQPELVTAGSVGIAGRQTGVYPFNSPGGWHIIGRTPLKLFAPSGSSNPSISQNKDDCYSLLRVGDEVQFIPITKDEFENY
jgi:inhibitor of KinA